MEYCPPYTVKTGSFWYYKLMDCIFFAGCIINTYVAYCIVCLSNKSMKTYRWYLLWHQALAFCTDISFNFLGQPVIFFPFRMGYAAGLLKDILAPFDFVALMCFFFFFEMCSDAHLFLYRLITIKGYDSFPIFYKIWATIPYILAIVAPTFILFVYPHQEATIEKYSKNYSCITKELLKIPNFIIFDDDDLKYSEKVQYSLFASVLFTTVICIVLSLRATTTKNMSAQLIRLQRKFLYQLIILIAVPLGIVAVPVLGFTMILNEKIFTYNDMGNLIISINSTSSIICGVSLIAMNKTYHYPFTRYLKRRKSVSVVPNTSTIL